MSMMSTPVCRNATYGIFPSARELKRQAPTTVQNIVNNAYGVHQSTGNENQTPYSASNDTLA